MAVRVLALQSGVTDLTGHRYHESAGFTQAGVGNARSGLIPASGAADVSQVSAMVVSVAGFAAWVDGTSSAGQAGYNVVADAATSLTIADGEASVARTDRIWLVVHHDTFDSSGLTMGAVEYAKGQASGAPTALPPSSVLLYEFTVPAGRSAANGGVLISSFVDKRAYTVAAGGMLPVTSQADRDAIAAPYKGMLVWRSEFGHAEVWDNQFHPLGIPLLTSVSVATTHIPNPADGQLVFARDTRSLYEWRASVSQWVAYAPPPVESSWTPTSSLAIPGTWTGKYFTQGRTVHFNASITSTATMTWPGANGAVSTLSLPIMSVGYGVASGYLGWGNQTLWTALDNNTLYFRVPSEGRTSTSPAVGSVWRFTGSYLMS